MDISGNNIELSFGKTNILNNVSITANTNKFIGIIGPNGSGKSTFLKCLYRVLKPDKGVVYIDDTKLNNLPVKESAKKIAVVAQHNFYNFDFTIEEVVMMGRSPHKKNMERDNAEDYKIVNECLEKVGMFSFKGRNFSTLSGGEQQRIILARALAQRTDCIILDEPTNHLDIKYQLQLLDIVKNLNLTIISAIHDLNIASMYCDYLYAMKDGKVIKEGSPKEVFTADLIKNLYEVDADVLEDKFGRLNITYYPKHLRQNK
ncbi:MAG: ABC transporter ATP-binding protein [Maledivibacter sp.]|jgi:iron complex transport system ATP-binding protein|nr:ABC transporter ATP-binding protein [Maledivibacter sp.]